MRPSGPILSDFMSYDGSGFRAKLKPNPKPQTLYLFQGVLAHEFLLVNPNSGADAGEAGAASKP